MDFFFVSVENNLLGRLEGKMENYEVNDRTLALCSLDSKTRVYEEGCTFIVNKPAYEIMEDSCEYFGSSIEGRKKGTFNLIGVTYKAPIIVEESKNIIFFPTCSPRLKNCSWLRSSKIDSYYYESNKLFVRFKNGERIVVNSSYGVIDNQIIRAIKLEVALKNRKSEKNIQI